MASNTKYLNKKVAILGYGIDTEDVIPYFLKQKAKVTIFDKKPNIVSKYFRNKNIKWDLGKDEFKDLNSFDVIVRNPAIYRYRKEIIEAETLGVEITSKIKIFFDEYRGKIIGVTGTKGKGTTSTLIYKILKQSKKDVYIGGNIGKKIMHLLPKLNKDSLVVLELSSFQLIDLKKSSNIAVILMTTQDHLDWHSSLNEYIQAKSNLTKFQKNQDVTIYNTDYLNSKIIGTKGKGIKYKFSSTKANFKGCYLKNNYVYFNKTKIIEINKVKLLGKHNLQNIMAAIATAKTLKIENRHIKKTIENFKGLEHRLQPVRKINNVIYINDSFSTVPDTTIAALKAFKEELVLIVGGRDKDSNYEYLIKELRNAKNLKILILIGETTELIKLKLLKLSKNLNFKIITGCKTMKEIVRTAYINTHSGMVVVMSPACTSFDMFSNYKERGKQFIKEVNELVNSKESLKIEV